MWKVVVGLILVLLVTTTRWTTIDTVTFTVSDKERVTLEDSSYFLVYTDMGTFKNTDSWFNLKVNSGDLQGKLVNGERFTCTKNMFRVPMLSWYENLLECKKL